MHQALAFVAGRGAKLTLEAETSRSRLFRAPTGSYRLVCMLTVESAVAEWLAASVAWTVIRLNAGGSSGANRGGYQAVAPPSTTMVWPVM